MNALLLAACLLGQVDYQVGFLAVPRDPAVASFGPQSFSEQNGPFVHHVGTSLYRIAPGGTRTLLVKGDDAPYVAVHDWCPSLDATGIYYSLLFQHEGRLYGDLFHKHLTTGEVTKLTDAVNEWNAPAGVYPVGSKGGVVNTAPCPTPEGLVFTSTRDGIKSPGEVFPAGLLYRLVDGHVERIDFMNFAGTLHPKYHAGWVYFSTAQQQGLRGRNGSGWGIWRIKPDGSSFEPVVSAIPVDSSNGFHIVALTSDGHRAFSFYYDTRAIGTILAFPKFEATPFGPPTVFGKPGAIENPVFWNGVNHDDTRAHQGNIWRLGFQPRDLFSVFPWAHMGDVLNTTPDATGATVYQREIDHPAGVPGNRLLVTWAGDKAEGRDLGIYLSKPITERPPAPGEGLPSAFPRDYLTEVADSPDMHEWYGQAIVPYEQIYGVPPPAMTPSPDADLPPGSPYVLIGSTSVDRPEVVDPTKNPFYSTQVTIDPVQIHYIRILGFNPTQTGLDVAQQVSNQPPGGSGPQTRNREGFLSAVNERMGIYGEIPVRKWRTPTGELHLGPGAPEGSTPVMAPNGSPDTSWAAYIPGDQSFSFQLLDEHKRAIANLTAQTWRQERPGKQRTNCQGCHNHNQPDQFQFTECAAGLSDYVVPKFERMRRVIYDEHIKPIEDRTGVVLGPTPYKVAGGPLPFASAGWDVLTNPAFTAAERETLAAWRDTGFMAAGVFNDGTPVTKESQHGPWADTMPATLRLNVRSDFAYIGAADPDSGVNYGTLQVLLNGTDITGQFAWTGDVAKGPTGEGTWQVSIRDNQAATGAEQGNVTRLTRTIGELPPPPPPPDPDDETIAELEARIAALEAQVSALQAKATQDAATIAELQGKINAARAALED